MVAGNQCDWLIGHDCLTIRRSVAFTTTYSIAFSETFLTLSTVTKLSILLMKLFLN